MEQQLVEKHIRTKRKIRKIVTYVSNDCALRREHENIVVYLRKNTYNSKFAKAYVKNSNIFKNAKAHMYNDVFVKMDIKDFFNSINHEILCRRLYSEINKKSYADDDTCANIVEKCSCGYPGLPLGLVTSPDLANLYLKRFDGLFYGTIKKQATEYDDIRDVIYTRYADDLVVSFKGDYLDEPDTRDFVNFIIRTASELLKNYKLKLNTDKTQVIDLYANNHVRITGVSIVRNPSDNYRAISVGKKFKNELFWKAINYYDNPKEVTDLEIQQLKGQLSFVISIEKRGISFTFSRGMRQLIYDRGYKNIIKLINALPNSNGFDSNYYNKGNKDSNNWSTSNNWNSEDCEYYSSGEGEGFDPSSWDAVGFFRENEYTVNQKDNLSDEERQTILLNLIKSGKVSKYRTINFLEAMISLRKGRTKYALAISKWQRDLNFVRGL